MGMYHHKGWVLADHNGKPYYMWYDSEKAQGYEGYYSTSQPSLGHMPTGEDLSFVFDTGTGGWEGPTEVSLQSPGDDGYTWNDGRLVNNGGFWFFIPDSYLPEGYTWDDGELVWMTNPAFTLGDAQKTLPWHGWWQFVPNA